MLSTPPIDLGYNGLTEHTEGLAADAYYDPRQYERELQRIWYRNWVYVGRSADAARARATSLDRPAYTQLRYQMRRSSLSY